MRSSLSRLRARSSSFPPRDFRTGDPAGVQLKLLQRCVLLQRRCEAFQPRVADVIPAEIEDSEGGEAEGHGGGEVSDERLLR